MTRYIREWRKRVYHPKWEEEMNREEWRKLRKTVLIRDGYMCQRCEKHSKSGKGLSVHHMVPRGEGGANEMNNLITLCQKCHDFVELEELRTKTEIIGSFEPESEPKKKIEVVSANWHTWVYGGGRNPLKDR